MQTGRRTRPQESFNFPDPPQPAEMRPLRSSRMMLHLELREAAEEFERPGHGVLLSAVSAGFGVGISILLLGIVHSSEQASPLLLSLLAANAYAVGFVIVILGRMDLFTEFTTIAILPVLARQATVRSLLRLWGLIYLGNIIGAAVFALLAAVLGPALQLVEPQVMVQLALRLTSPAWWVILLSSGVAGWLMGVLSWLITGGRDTISQIIFTWLIAGTIGFAHLHHAITGTAEVLAGMLAGTSISWRALGHFLLWTTLGNSIGGILFAASVRFSLHMRHKEAPESGS